MLLTHEQFQIALSNYYIEHYGERDTDRWFPDPAVNVRVFAREGKLITLKSHVLTGIVSESIEDFLLD